MTKIERDLEDHEPRIVSGVKGVKSTPFTKKFKNAAAQEKWENSPEFDHEIYQVIVA
jgi:hypothetical protein